VVVAGAAAMLLAAGYLAGYAATSDTVPREATVAGVALGGQPRAQAIATLRNETAGRARTPITVQANGRTFEVKPGDAGLRIDYGASVAQTGVGHSLSPRNIFHALTGGGAHPLVVVADPDLLNQATDAIAQQADQPATDATVAITAGAQPTVTVTQGVDGSSIDRPGLATALVQAYATGTTAVAPVVTAEPAISTAEAEAVADTFARLALAGPIRINAGSAHFDVTPAMIAKV